MNFYLIAHVGVEVAGIYSIISICLTLLAPSAVQVYIFCASLLDIALLRCLLRGVLPRCESCARDISASRHLLFDFMRPAKSN